MTDIFETKKDNTAQPPKHIFHLHRKLFLLVFAIAILGQSLLFVDLRLQNYYEELQKSFKVILTVNNTIDNNELGKIGDSLNQKTDIVSVRLYSPQDGLEKVRTQNPQLVDSLLLMGKNKMPAYFELKLAPQAIANVGPFVENLTAEYGFLIPHYNQEHAAYVFYAGICAKILRIALVCALGVFLLFMFLIEASYSARPLAHSWGGAVSGILAGVGAGVLLAALIYPTGFLAQAVWQFTTPAREILLLVFCALLGWTLSKWQKF